MWIRAALPPWPAATVISKIRRWGRAIRTLGPTAEDSKYYCVGIHRNAQGFSSSQLLPCTTNADCSTERLRRRDPSAGEKNARRRLACTLRNLGAGVWLGIMVAGLRSSPRGTHGSFRPKPVPTDQGGAGT